MSDAIEPPSDSAVAGALAVYGAALDVVSSWLDVRAGASVVAHDRAVRELGDALATAGVLT